MLTQNCSAAGSVQ